MSVAAMLDEPKVEERLTPVVATPPRHHDGCLNIAVLVLWILIAVMGVLGATL